MNETEVSRVAEALAQSFRETVAAVSGDSWEATGVTLPSKEVWERYARAAVEAMREPTDAMVQSVTREVYPSDQGFSEFEAASTWGTMIETALATPLPGRGR